MKEIIKQLADEWRNYKKEVRKNWDERNKDKTMIELFMYNDIPPAPCLEGFFNYLEEKYATS